MKALIAMSGGVDSSVAALFTKTAGYDCIGCTMRLYEYPEDSTLSEEGCCTLSGVEDARSVAFRLGMPYYVFNLKDDFEKQVIRKFARSYVAGETPNPCIDCNRYLKFARLYERAKELGCEKIVTGHYARIREENGHWYLYKGADPKKDQSYVLYTLTEEQLKHTLFPLGDHSKEEIRKTALENGFVNAKKPDSQDICFVPDGDYASVVERYADGGTTPGNFVNRKGEVLGRHKGLIHYTVGQRRGLGIAWTESLYVLYVDPARNEVVLGTEKEQYSEEAYVREFHWITGEAPEDPFRAAVRIRYHKKETPATVTPLGGGRAKIAFDAPERAVTPGQAAVFYDGDRVLGGGVLTRPELP